MLVCGSQRPIVQVRHRRAGPPHELLPDLLLQLEVISECDDRVGAVGLGGRSGATIFVPEDFEAVMRATAPYAIS